MRPRPPSWYGEQIQPKTIRIAKAPVIESAEKLETGNPVKSLRHLGDADNRDGLVKIQLRNANIHQVDTKHPRIGAAELNVVNQNGRTLKAVIFVEEQLKDRLSSAGAGVGHEATNDVLSTARRQHNLDDRTVVLEKPLGSRHQTTLQLSSTRS